MRPNSGALPETKPAIGVTALAPPPMVIASFVAGMLTLCVIGIPLLIVLLIYELVLVIVAAVRCAEGARWRYPLTMQRVP